jgi:hypothetical protein
MKRVTRLLSVAALAPLILTSCDSSNTFDPFEDVEGTYELSVYAGSSVPATFTCQPGQCTDVFTNGGTIRINDGTLTLYDDGTFQENNRFTFTPTGQASYNDSFTSIGTYEVNGDQLELFAPEQNGVEERFLLATVEFGGNDVRVRYIEDGFQYEYRR